VCQLLFETVTKNAIRSSATRLAGKTIELILDGRQDMTDDDEEYRVIDRCEYVNALPSPGADSAGGHPPTPTTLPLRLPFDPGKIPE